MTQFTEIRADAAAINSQVRALILRRSPSRRTAATTPTINTKHHTIRWARISNAPAGLSRGKNAGNRPHDAYAPTPNSNPDRLLPIPKSLRSCPPESLTVRGYAARRARAAGRADTGW